MHTVTDSEVAHCAIVAGLKSDRGIRREALQICRVFRARGCRDHRRNRAQTIASRQDFHVTVIASHSFGLHGNLAPGPIIVNRGGVYVFAESEPDVYAVSSCCNADLHLTDVSRQNDTSGRSTNQQGLVAIVETQQM
jgi:hypothetical protein